ncbi:hypothetical protein HDU83_007830 [Entophlyctis luteolus]|nr:hypothetical protein HDU83_007830 [Entophlyctis luteolus]
MLLGLRAAAAGVRRRFAVAPSRSYATVLRGTPVMLNILDPWLPRPVSLLSFFSKEGRAALWQRTRRSLTYAMSLYQLRKNSLTVAQFKADAETLYIFLNKALASSDRQLLDRAATVSYASLLAPELKKLKKNNLVGEWNYKGPIKISVVNLVAARAEGDASKGDKAGLFIQLTAKVSSRQTYALYDANTRMLVGGDPNKVVDLEEYVVFERKMNDDAVEHARIAAVARRPVDVIVLQVIEFDVAAMVPPSLQTITHLLRDARTPLTAWRDAVSQAARLIAPLQEPALALPGRISLARVTIASFQGRDLGFHGSAESSRAWVSDSLLPALDPHNPDDCRLFHAVIRSVVSAELASKNFETAQAIEEWFLPLIFSALPNSPGSSDLMVSYASLIEAYSRMHTKSSMSRAVMLFNTMISHSQMKPSVTTYSHLLQGFAALKDIRSCRYIYDRLLFIGHSPDVVFYTTLLQAYVKCGEYTEATKLHESLVQKHNRNYFDVRYYNVLVNLHAKTNALEKLLETFEEMTLSLDPDEHTYTTMIDAFMRNGELRFAIFLFDAMQGHATYNRKIVEPLDSPANTHKPIIPTTATYTALISGYARRKDVGEALRWFQLLCANSKRGEYSKSPPFSSLGPNLKSWTAVLHGFAKAGDMDLAEDWINRMANELPIVRERSSRFDSRVYNTLIGGYARKQDYPRATRVLDSMRRDNVHQDAITFGMLIDSHLKRTELYPDGNIEQALKTFKEMSSHNPPIQPTMHIFIALITRLGHAAGKSDRLGRPVVDRQGGGVLPHLRKNLPPPPRPTELFSSRKQLGFIPLSRRARALHEDNLIFLYREYRKLLSTLALDASAAQKSLPAPSIPIALYDAVIAHFTTLHQTRKMKEIFFHAIIDGAIPDMSLVVRTVKGFSFSSGWGGAVHFARQSRLVLVEITKLRSVAVQDAKASQAVSAGRADEVWSKSSNRQSPLGSMLLIPTDEEIGFRRVEYAKLNIAGLGNLVRGLLGDVQDLHKVLARWMDDDEQSELLSVIDQALLASYPVYVFKANDWNRLNESERNLRGTLLRYDAQSRRHSVGIDMFDEANLLRLWSIVVRLNVARGTVDSFNFKEFRLIYFRFCEANGFWAARDEAVRWLTTNGRAREDAKYRKWLHDLR